MHFLEKHKALLITALITGTVILAMFSFSLTKKAEFLAESYYEMEPQTIEELKELRGTKNFGTTQTLKPIKPKTKMTNSRK